MRLGKDNSCDSVQPRCSWLSAETSRLSFIRLCYQLGVATLVLLSCVSTYSAATRNKILPDPVINLMRAEAPRCAEVCGLSCIRPWAPAAAFSMPYDGGLFACLRSGPVTPVRIQCTRQSHVTRCPESSVPVWPRGGELVRFQKEELDLLRIPIPGLASVVTSDDVVSVASTRNKIDQRSGHPALTCPARYFQRASRRSVAPGIRAKS